VPEVAEPEVHVYDTTTHRVVERFVIEGLDQINGVTTLETAPQASDFLGEFATDRVAPVEG
jgi:cyclophilin family peptidyl-prolyl cis-trans isomerase